MRGIWALLERSLRLDARHIGPHVLRLVVLASAYFMVCLIVGNSVLFGAPGHRLMLGLGYIVAVLIALAGLGPFSTAISEEKEAGTLGLLLLTGLSPLVLLLGKSTSRLVQALLQLLLLLPVALLAVTLGGVVLPQVFAALAALAAFLFCVANAGLLCSVLARRNGDAAGLMGVWLTGYAIGPLVLLYVYGAWAASPPWWLPSLLRPLAMELLRLGSRTSVFRELYLTLQTGAGASLVSVQVVSNVALGLICFGLSWKLFPLLHQSLDAAPPARRLVAASLSGLRGTWRTAGRPWSNPFLWHAFHFTSGGVPMICVKFCIYGCVQMLVVYVLSAGFQEVPRLEELVNVGIGWLTVLLALELIIHSPRVFAGDIREQTWASALLVPRPLPEVAYSRVAGCLLGMAPAAGLCALGWLTSRDLQRVLRELVEEYGFWTMLLFYLSLLHLIVWSSLDRGGKGSAAGLLIAIGSVIVLVILVNQLFWREPHVIRAFFVFLVDPLLVAWCVGSHWLIGRKLANAGGE